MGALHQIDTARSHRFVHSWVMNRSSAAGAHRWWDRIVTASRPLPRRRRGSCEHSGTTLSHPLPRTVIDMDQLILAARDVVDAWEHHTVELEIVIHQIGRAHV